MRVLKVFFLGFVYGWFMKWIIDEIYTRDNFRMITDENIVLKERIKSLEAPKSLETLSVKRTAPAPEPKPTARASTKDDLKVIKGVGPVMEKKLNAAGVQTFEALSRLTANDLQNILGISKRVTQSADNLLSQARKFAQQKAKR